MKKFVLITLFSAICFVASAQFWTDSIAITDISGTDTTIFVNFRTEQGSSITFDYTNFDAWDATLSFGYSADQIGMTTIDDTRNPFTLDSTSITAIDVNGTTKVRLAFESDKWSFRWIAFKLTKNTVSSGTLIWQIAR